MPLSHFTLAVAILLGILHAVIAYTLVRKPRKFRKHAGPWWQQVALGAFGGAIVGTAVLAAIAPDKIPHTDAPTLLVHVAMITTCVGLGIASANLRRTTLGRKILAASAAAVLILVAAVTVNISKIDAPAVAVAPASNTLPLLPRMPRPAMPTPAPALGPFAEPSPDLASAGYPVASTLDTSWHAPTGMPSSGRVETVTIPGATSHFDARPAQVYLPPAALTPHAPRLPVVILLSGQPASPASVAIDGHTVDTLNTLAARNHGLAPIVVIPDQLGQPQNNPMCVNGPLGNVKTYIATDVTRWIVSHLTVLPGRDAWAIGGFSEGGTCAIQFATAFPDVFGSFIDVSGEQYPTLATDTAAIQEDFGGSTLLYDRAKPQIIMNAHGTYTDTIGVFAVGANDRHYGPIMQLMSAAAHSRGIHVSRYISPGTGHDWTTASNGFAAGLGTLYPRFGLAPTGQYVPIY